MTKQDEINKIEQSILKANPTPELSASANNLVMGSGDLDSKIIFIGEAPGRLEDETGLPFVGASGKLLDKLLASVGMSREKVYVTNIVKYRPPENRDPTEAEKKAFWSYLLQQIAVIKPKIVATLGRHSGKYFLPDLTISEHHGLVQNIKLMLENKETNVAVLPLYHPAAAIYNGSLRDSLFEDFIQIPKLIK